jgi:hypothetical protein
MIVHIYNLTLERLKQENGEFEASLGYLVRHYLKKPINKF